ncbi:MAG: hypothetical protein WCG26_04000 [Chloroflexales bacterium]
MAQQRRPTAPPRASRGQPHPAAGQPLAPPVPHLGRAGSARVQPSAPSTTEPVGGEHRISFGMIVVSLPVALSFGQMLIDKNLSALPQTVGWTAVVVAYHTITAPGVARGFFDWMGDSVNLGPEVRERLGIPAVLPKVAAKPRTRGVLGWLDGVGADVQNIRAAMAARRGEPFDAGEPTGQRGTAISPVGWANAANGAVDALDDDDEGPADAPDIGLPVVRLEAIADRDNLWVVGPKGSGKTTVLRRLLELRRGKHWALDPHATPGKWPGCTVVGGGRDFAVIDVQLDRFIDWMDGRYKSMDDGSVTEAQCAASRRTLVGDEWRAIRKNLPGAKDMPSAAARLLDILSEGRKAGICALAASHLDTAEGMGITGEKDMLKCFDMIIYLGAMATKYVPTSARMARPAVVYDPEHDVWAQLIIALPTAAAEPTPDEDAPEPAGPVALQKSTAASPRRAPVITPPPPVLPTAAPPDDLLAGLLARAGAPAPLPALPPDADLSAVSPGRAARLAAILGRQGAAAPTLASATAPTAALAQGAVAPTLASATTPTTALAQGAAAPVTAPTPPLAAAQGETPTSLLPPGQRVTVEQSSGGQVVVNVQQVTQRGAAPRRRQRGKRVNVKDRRRRLAYLEAARKGEKFNPTYRRLGGHRNTMLTLFKSVSPHQED